MSQEMENALLFVSDFNGILCSSIDETISDLLSIRVMESLYTYLLEKHGITRMELPYRLELFSSAIENFFGAKSARTIGRTVARHLYAHLQLRFEDRPNFTLSDYVDEAKKILQSNNT
ncbi:MAG: hypothetical protein ACHQ03_09720 [Candidatus Bathyarchaeia archaeon]